MKKGKLWILIIIVGLIAAISILFGMKKQENNMEHILKTAIRIQYGWGSMNQLKSLCTPSMANRTDLHTFRVGWGLYSINEDEGYILEDPANSQKMTVSVAVYSPDLRFHVFSLVKDDKGVYKIANIEYDI